MCLWMGGGNLRIWRKPRKVKIKHAKLKMFGKNKVYLSCDSRSWFAVRRTETANYSKDHHCGASEDLHTRPSEKPPAELRTHEDGIHREAETGSSRVWK